MTFLRHESPALQLLPLETIQQGSLEHKRCIAVTVRPVTEMATKGLQSGECTQHGVPDKGAIRARARGSRLARRPLHYAERCAT